MALTRRKLGELIERSDVRNADGALTVDAVRGISIQKVFIPTKADMAGVSLSPYKLVVPGQYGYVTVTSRNGGKITLGFNDSNDTYLVSGTYEVFAAPKKDEIDGNWLYMFFNRPEFDRYARFNSWGSARETFSWEDMCDVELDLPPIDVQRKYVAIYEAMLKNQRSYEQGLDDLKLACDAWIEGLGRELTPTRIGPFINQSDERNGSRFDVDSVRGISIEKKLIETKANMTGVSLTSYKTMKPGQLVYVPVTSRNGGKISLALNGDDETFIVSSINIVFSTDSTRLLPEYLMLFFSRSEFDRYARFNSWGSARETFDWDAMCDVRIPLPPIETQRAVVDLYNALTLRKEINGRLKAQLKDICPILIKGSLEEGSR